jgi:DNA-binding response OmpR family regulator
MDGSLQRRVRGLRVLIADDNRDAADTLAWLVGRARHEARTAHDGKQALEIALSGWVDIAVLDIEMPLVSGYEIAAAVRAHVSTRRMALIALTGWSQEAQRAKARAAGFDRFLIKPVEFGDLDALLRTLGAWVRLR